jgi:hypothetical protein
MEVAMPLVRTGIADVSGSGQVFGSGQQQPWQRFLHLPSSGSRGDKAVLQCRERTEDTAAL